jgi:hypothetical protein
MKISITHYIINIKSYTKTCHLFLMDWQLIYQFLDNLLPGK